MKQVTIGCAKLALALMVLGNYQPGFAVEPLSVSSSPQPLTPAQPSADVADPSDVFRAKIRIRDRFTAEITFAIRPGYYLYRDRLQVELLDQTATGQLSPATVKKAAAVAGSSSATKTNALLALSIPNGKAVDDPTFGKVEVFETGISILVDLSRFQIAPSTEKPAPPNIKIALISQGCAIAGICYPPLSHEFLLPLQLSSAPDSWINPHNETSLRFGQATRVTQSSWSGKTRTPGFDPSKSSSSK